MTELNEIGGHVHIYKDASSKWRWRRIAANGRVLGDSGQGYARRYYCRAIAERDFPGVDIHVETGYGKYLVFEK